MSPRTRRQTGKIPLCYMKLSVELNSFRLFLTSISSDPQPSDLLTVQVLSPHPASSAVCFAMSCLCNFSFSPACDSLYQRGLANSL